MTVTEAFQTFKSQLELPDRKQEQAAAAQQALRDAIQVHLHVSGSFLTGSYARYTKIHPLNDIDVFLVRNDRPVGLCTDGSGVTPVQAISEIESAVRKALPGASARPQARSVNVAVPGLEFGFDLVPAWLRSPSGYWIPDLELGTWLPTDPKAHADILTDANKQAGGALKPVIKMTKQWSRNNLDLLRSFHIELILVQIFRRNAIDSYQLGVATTLIHISDYVGREMLDPVYSESRVDKPLSVGDLAKLKLRIATDAESCVSALRLEEAGRQQEAIAEWRRIFLSGFPS